MSAPGLLAVGAGAAVATCLLAPLVLMLLRRFQVVDVPNHRSSHHRPTLRGGGLAVLGGVLLVALVTDLLPYAVSVPWVAVAGCVLLSALGLSADLTDIGPLSRFVGQALIGAAVGSLLGDWLTALIGAIAVPVLVNAVNFMDGINGITALTMAAWGLVVATGSTSGAALLAALTVGGALGFLPWNVPQARMFLGDSGSYLFGGLAAMALLLEQSAGAHPALVLAPLVPYLADTGFTLLRRARRGGRLTEAHREHLYQRLSRRSGWGHVSVASLWAFAALACGTLAVAIVRQNGML
ncbi:UDP-phosphate glycosyltransferase [Ornithinimicrobium sp. Y1694]|uniref:UDP-phosphate glycosyltransferase n=1 Tax=Ornithinimicrobium sp. Y1694 TaxID=3418590 RepID=UPI003CEC3A3C